MFFIIIMFLFFFVLYANFYYAMYMYSTLFPFSCSPHDDQDAQKAADTFFSQKVILPSPWPVSRHMPHPPQGDSPGVTRPPSSSQKKVTFSPQPSIHCM